MLTAASKGTQVSENTVRTVPENTVKTVPENTVRTAPENIVKTVPENTVTNSAREHLKKKGAKKECQRTL